MKTELYRLGEYKIVVSETGEIHWEAHSGVGSLNEGICYKKGEILFIGPAVSLKEGFLKLEFIDSLKYLPSWTTTKFYSTNIETYICENGKKVTTEEMRLWSFDKKNLYDNKLNNEISANTAFKLCRYKISINSSGEINYSLYASPNILLKGKCIIIEDILFMNTVQNKETFLSKEEFKKDFDQLPKWEHTRYYSPKYLLKECRNEHRKLQKKKHIKKIYRKTENKNADPQKEREKTVSYMKYGYPNFSDIFNSKVLRLTHFILIAFFLMGHHGKRYPAIKKPFHRSYHST